jgi:hypothetical protein
MHGDHILAAAVMETQVEILCDGLIVPHRDHAVVVAFERPETNDAARRVGLRRGGYLKDVTLTLIDAARRHVEIAILALKRGGEMSVAVR